MPLAATSRIQVTVSLCVMSYLHVLATMKQICFDANAQGATVYADTWCQFGCAVQVSSQVMRHVHADDHRHDHCAIDVLHMRLPAL